MNGGAWAQQNQGNSGKDNGKKPRTEATLPTARAKPNSTSPVLAAPEIDAGTGVGAIALLAGTLLLVSERRRRIRE